MITVSNVIRVSSVTDELRDYVMDNLIIPNPEYSKKLRMGFWVGDTPTHLYLYETEGGTLVLPYGVLRDMTPEMLNNETPISLFTSHERVIDVYEDIPLYDYQYDAVEAMYKAHYGILQSPAGSGKTQMGIALVKKFGTRALWLTHTIDLLNQSKARAEQYMYEHDIGTITEGKVDIGYGITFATIQTMCKLDLNKYRDMFDVIIVDECHRVAGSPTSLTQFYKVLSSLSAKHKYGLSATVHRSDGMIKATFALLGKVVHTVPEEAVGDKIMRVGIKPVETGVKIDKCCLNSDGTLNYARLINYLAEDEFRCYYIVSYIKDNKDRSCLILSDRLAHLEKMMNMLPQDMRDEAVMVSGKMTSKKGKAEREQAIEDMRTGKKKYLFATYSLAKEGLDIPRLERLFLTTPQKDYAVITQSIGRIARVFEGKSDPIAYDFVDDIGYLFKSYKKRCTTYRKNRCYFVGDE